MPAVGFEPIISASDRPQNYALDRTDTGTDLYLPMVALIRVGKWTVLTGALVDSNQEFKTLFDLSQI
jgi:hypothetical protein